MPSSIAAAEKATEDKERAQKQAVKQGREVKRLSSENLLLTQKLSAAEERATEAESKVVSCCGCSHLLFGSDHNSAPSHTRGPGVVQGELTGQVDFVEGELDTMTQENMSHVQIAERLQRSEQQLKRNTHTLEAKLIKTQQTAQVRSRLVL